MGRASGLTEAEKGAILAYNKLKMSYRAISKQVNRSTKVISNFLKDPNKYGTSYGNKNACKLSERDKRRLAKEASSTGVSARNLVTSLKMDISVRTVQRYLKDSSVFQYVKRNKAPKLSNKNKEARVKWAKSMLSSNTNWSQIVWSDEKKFNLDGPDGLGYYWHDIRQAKQTFFSRHSGGGSVMVWGCFSGSGLGELALLTGKQTAQNYCTTISNYLVPFMVQHYGDNTEEWAQFQQDNAPIHKAMVTKQFLLHEKIKVMDWPAYSPDLNPIENLWGLLSRAVYRNGRQFSTRSDLIQAIFEEWGKIQINYLHKLVESMPNRCFQVIERKGDKSSY